MRYLRSEIQQMGLSSQKLKHECIYPIIPAKQSEDIFNVFFACLVIRRL